MPVNLNINTRTIIGKVKARSQLCRIYTEDGRIILTEPSVLKACIADDSKVAAWVIDADNQVMNEDTRQWEQLLDERSIIPVPAVTGKSEIKDQEKLTHQIFHDSWVIDLIMLDNEQKRDKQRTWWFVILGTPIILAALILGLKVLGH
jgi:hypothetical protein